MTERGGLIRVLTNLKFTDKVTTNSINISKGHLRSIYWFLTILEEF